MLINEFMQSYEEKSMLTDLIEENKITLIHGESGSGKSVFAVKHLNENRIEPFIADFDDNNPRELELNGLKARLLDGSKFLRYLLYEGPKEIPKKDELLELYRGAVIVIDTWTLFVRELYEGEELHALLALQRVSALGFTFIVISHTNEFAGKEPVPDVSPEVYRHMKARLYIRRNTRTNDISYDLLIEKLKGYKGPKSLNIRTEKRV